ncbi:hypothetical protein CHS0354_006078 [Potamilus streckersoni]|uniref:Peptidoglycan-recognition protein n=1 Tax=Potamilus streckersoni TaxID=2493646 RepID=A0AAE0ST82_9BIVA|nr:hypothetical protein CHS0354_006078 [Potamilus streckersoni]
MSGREPWTGQAGPPSLKNLNLMTRAEWGARDTRNTEYMATPVSIVFIHHTAMSRCQDHESCCQELRRIQNFHMDDRGWDDIAYNYLIGENGCVYEGRGWNRVGAHTAGWNKVAIGLSLLGDFTSVAPDPRALDAVRNLLDLGVAEGKISANYKLYGHKDVRNTTECPGQKLYDIISKWDNYDSNQPICPN